MDKVEAEAGKRILAKYPDIKDVHELLKEQRLPRCHIYSTASFNLTSKRQLPTHLVFFHLAPTVLILHSLNSFGVQSSTYGNLVRKSEVQSVPLIWSSLRIYGLFGYMVNFLMVPTGISVSKFLVLYGLFA